MSKENTPLTEKEEVTTVAEDVKSEETMAETIDTAEAAEEKTDGKKNNKKPSFKQRLLKAIASEEKKTKKAESEMTEEEKKAAEEKKKKAAKNKPKNAKSSAKRLIGYITKQKAWLFVVAVLVILSTIVSVCSSLIMQPVYTAIEGVLIHHADPNAAFSKIVKYLVVMSIAYIISALMSFLYTRIMLTVSVKVLTNMRRELFNHMQGLPLSFFDKRKTGEIMSHFTSDIGRVSDLVQNTFTDLISSSIQAILTITIMIIYSWQITLSITVAIFFMLLAVVLVTKKCEPYFKNQQKTMADCNGYIEEYIRGIKVVKIFSYEEKSKKEFAEINEAYRKNGVTANIIGGLLSPIMSMITRLNYAVAVSVGASMAIKGKMQIPQLVTYLQYVGSYGTPVAAIASSYSTLISALAGAERIFEVLDTPTETDEGKITLAKTIKNMYGIDEEDESGTLSWKIPQEDGSSQYVPVNCDIDIDNVTFSYVEDKQVLKHITTHANSGEKLAFVGSTGAGKTTITNLINRFYEVEDGCIKIDGIDIRDIKKDDLRSTMAFVLQDSKLFVGTIADNIRYGKLDATDEEIVAAAKLANADSFIDKLPDKYETEIRADGVNISVGQAQLINIARAAISGRPLLVLDEATSSVDTRTERLIEIGMDQLMDNKTVLVIAHRLSTVRNSQEIVVLEDGEIIEHGTHNALIDLAGKYYQLYTGIFEMK
ncbi:MAG: ABC transporter ATP-binding protein/permease [Faecalibacterium sp.]|nr:ABC transporter ATP-binding protein/permease [Ruminococcus sp.]MCM1391826.1 ABC transporter ATP-binding protein/permease [Ruminococcus sp.]MCM1485472.1 ABC transporter ATP-binding protein/permease [Faecalibacterium sp.]